MNIKMLLISTSTIVFVLIVIYLVWSFRSFFRYTFNDFIVIGFVLWSIILLSGLIFIILFSGVL